MHCLYKSFDDIDDILVTCLTPHIPPTMRECLIEDWHDVSVFIVVPRPSSPHGLAGKMPHFIRGERERFRTPKKLERVR